LAVVGLPEWNRNDLFVLEDLPVEGLQFGGFSAIEEFLCLLPNILLFVVPYSASIGAHKRTHDAGEIRLPLGKLLGFQFPTATKECEREIGMLEVKK